MTIFNKAIPRRTFLRGAGATLALPLLDSMVPVLTPVSGAVSKSASRLSFIYVPNGTIMQRWTPQAVGSNYQLTPILEPLAPFRDQFLVLSGLDHNAADPLPGEGEVAPHERAGATFLTGVHPKREGNVGISVDQIAASRLGQQTQLASLELGLHNTDVVGQCEKGWSCAYLNTLSWRSPTTPLPTENRPRAVFERLFGDNTSTDVKTRLARIQKDQSLLDSVTEAAAGLMARLGPGDRARLGEYLDAIRDVERRIQMAEAQSSREMPVVDRPVGVPDTFDEHAKLMFDLQVLAYQTDLTRVITFMFGREQSTRAYRELGIPDAHHGLSHHQYDEVKIEKVTQISTYHSQMFAYFLERLRSTQDGEGSLLDNTTLVYGSALSDGNEHLMQDLPVLVAGGGAGRIQGGKHIRYPEQTPMSNLFLTLLDNLDIPLDNFGDSTGKLELLSL